jgi:site-specific DNA-methyltransferase (adenine-specific)
MLSNWLVRSKIKTMEINKIYNENCLETMAKMPDKFVDLTVTSPPYDDLRTYKGFEFRFEDIAKELYRVTKQGGVVVWVVGDATVNGSETGTSFKQALYFKEIGFNLHDTMIYHKLNPMPVKSNRYLPCFEYMFVLSKGKPKVFNAIREKTLATGKEKYTGTQQENGKFTDYGKERNLERDRYNIWSVKVGSNQTTKDKIAFQHPAIFPEQLANDHIISWSNEGDLIYDPFMGSGTTAKMAILNNRNYIGSEISSEYCNIIQERIKKALEEQVKKKEYTLFV